jgi:hypothetical protein
MGALSHGGHNGAHSKSPRVIEKIRLECHPINSAFDVGPRASFRVLHFIEILRDSFDRIRATAARSSRRFADH